MKGKNYATVLCVVAFTDLLAISMVVPLLGQHLLSLGFSQFMSGFMSSLYAALQLISSPLIGSWSDIQGRRAIFMQTMGICSICYLILGCTSSLLILLLLRIVIGILKHTQSLCKALVADSVSHSLQSDAYGKMHAVASIGFMVGPVIGGHLADVQNGFFYICCIVAVTLWINIGIVYIFVPECSPTFSDSNAEKSDNIKRDSVSWQKKFFEVFTLLRSIDWPRYWEIFTLKFLAGFSHAVFYFSYGFYIRETFGLNSKWVGYTISFQGLVGAVCGMSAGLLKKLYKQDTTYSIQLFHVFIMLLISFLILGTASSLSVFVVGLIPLVVSGTLIRIIGMEAILEITDADKRGSLVGSSNSMSSIARLIAPLFGGLVHDLTGYHGIFLLTQVSSGIGALLAFYLVQQQNRLHKNK